MTVDSVGDVGRYASLAFSPSGQPAIGYYDQTNGDLKYASFNGANWNVTTVDTAGVTGWYCSLAFIGGQPAISYYDSTTGDLRYAAFDGSAWQPATVVSAGNVGQYTSLKARPNGLPAISYFDVTPGEAEHPVDLMAQPGCRSAAPSRASTTRPLWISAFSLRCRSRCEGRWR